MGPAVSVLALPGLLERLQVEQTRCAKFPVYARTCGDTRVDLERQIKAARTGAATWTDTAGSVWGAGGRLVGGTVPAPGESFQGLDLRN